MSVYQAKTMKSGFHQKLEAALALDLPYAERGFPRELKAQAPQEAQASVLVLFGSGSPAHAQLLLTRRTETVETHKGQMAFPGGMNELGESATDAALRETEEEVGIPRAIIRVLGCLPALSTFTGFRVTPVLAMLEETPEELRLRPSPDEIAEALWVPLDTLRDPGTYRKEWFERGQVRFPVHAYYVGDSRNLRIWGATGAIIQNVLARLEAVGC